MPPLLPPRLYNPSTDSPHLPTMATIHAACITIDHQLVTFLPPLSDAKILAYWQANHARVERGEAAIFLQFAGTSSEEEGEEGGEGELAGIVCLGMPWSETGPFRGSVEKLMVSPAHRRQGVARRLMACLEAYAKEKGRWLLKLDTTIGTPAEQIYPRLGWTAYGVIPNYGFSPKDGRLVDERFFYKDLRDL